MKPFYIKIKNVILDIVFPPLCISCNQFLENKGLPLICEDCLSKIPLHNSTFCPVCERRLSAPADICRHNKNFSYILAPAANYCDKTVQNLIKIFKYGCCKPAGNPLSKIVIAYIDKIGLFQNLNAQNTIIVPIPLHPKKQKQRSFNQAEIIAENISKKFTVPLVHALTKNKKTKPNASMKDIDQRKANVSNSFSPKNPELIARKNIILIDDIHTTGATASEAVKVLKFCGAKRIIVLVIAKA